MNPTRHAFLTDATLLLPYLRQRLTALAATDSLEASPNPPAASAVTPFALDSGVRHAAVLIPLYSVERLPSLLFTRRTTSLSSHAGQISFPGGRRDPGDPTAVATALREAHEELGLDPALVEVLGELPAAFTVASNHLVLPVVGWLTGRLDGRLAAGVDGALPALRPNPAEVAAVIEAPLVALADPAIYHEEVWTRGGAPHTVRFYDLGPNRIWGLTASILHTLLSLLPETP